MKMRTLLILAVLGLGMTYDQPAQAALCPATPTMVNCWFALGQVVLPNTPSNPWTYGRVFTYPDPYGGYTTEQEAVALAYRLMAANPQEVDEYLGRFGTDAQFASAVMAKQTCNHFTDKNCPGGRYYTGVIYKAHL